MDDQGARIKPRAFLSDLHDKHISEYCFEVVGGIDRYPRYKNKRTLDVHVKCFTDQVGTEIKKEWDLPTPNAEAAYKSLGKYGKNTISLEVEKVEKLNRAWVFMTRQFGPYMSESDILTVEEAIETLDKSTSSGAPFNFKYKTKKELLDNDPDIVKWLESDWERLATDPYWSGLFTSSLKEEIRPLEKIEQNSQRTFTAGAMDVTVQGNRLFHSMNNKMYDAKLVTASAISMSPLKGNWDVLYRKLNVFKNGYALDETQYDSSLREFLLWGICKFRFNCLKEKFRTPENLQRMRTYYRNLINSLIITPEGVILMKKLGNPSGSVNTVTDNTLILYWLMAYAWICLATDDEWATYENFECNTAKALLGDDNTWTVSDEAHVFYSGPTVIEQWKDLGIITTTDSMVARKAVDLDFLSAKTIFLDGVAVPLYDRNKLYISLLYAPKEKFTPETTLNRVACLMQIGWTDKVFRRFCRSLIDFLLEKYDHVLMNDERWIMAKCQIMQDQFYYSLFTGGNYRLPTQSCQEALERYIKLDKRVPMATPKGQGKQQKLSSGPQKALGAKEKTKVKKEIIQDGKGRKEIVTRVKTPVAPGLRNQNYRTKKVTLENGKTVEILKIGKGVANYAMALCDPANTTPVGIPDALITCDSLKCFSYTRAEAVSNQGSQKITVVLVRTTTSSDHYGIWVSNANTTNSVTSKLSDIVGTQYYLNNCPFNDSDLGQENVAGRAVCYGARMTWNGPLSDRQGTYYTFMQPDHQNVMEYTVAELCSANFTKVEVNDGLPKHVSFACPVRPDEYAWSNSPTPHTAFPFMGFIFIGEGQNHVDGYFHNEYIGNIVTGKTVTKVDPQGFAAVQEVVKHQVQKTGGLAPADKKPVAGGIINWIMEKAPALIQGGVAVAQAVTGLVTRNPSLMGAGVQGLLTMGSAPPAPSVPRLQANNYAHGKGNNLKAKPKVEEVNALFNGWSVDPYYYEYNDSMDWICASVNESNYYQHIPFPKLEKFLEVPRWQTNPGRTPFPSDEGSKMAAYSEVQEFMYNGEGMWPTITGGTVESATVDVYLGLLADFLAILNDGTPDGLRRKAIRNLKRHAIRKVKKEIVNLDSVIDKFSLSEFIKFGLIEDLWEESQLKVLIYDELEGDFPALTFAFLDAKELALREEKEKKEKELAEEIKREAKIRQITALMQGVPADVPIDTLIKFYQLQPRNVDFPEFMKAMGQQWMPHEDQVRDYLSRSRSGSS